MAKSFNVSFNINGAMDGSLQAALKAAANAMRGLGNAAKSASAAAAASKTGLAGMAAGLNQIQQAAQKFRELKKAFAETQRGMTDAQKNVNQMARKLREDEKAAEALRQKLSQLREEQKKNANATSTERGTVNALRAERAQLKAQLKELGVNGRKIPREMLGTEKGRQVASLLTSLNANKAALETHRSQFRALGEEAKKLAASIRETQTALKTQEQAARQSGRGFEDAKSKAAALKESLRQQQEAVQRLRTFLGSSGFSTANFAASERQLAAEIDRVNAALRQQQALTNAQNQSARASQEMFNAYNNFQGALSTAGAIASPFTSAVENAMTFEHAMSRVKALTQTSNIMAGDTETVQREMALLEGQARELGATTQFTMTQAADAMGYLGMAGWKTEQIYGTMPGMLNLAAGAGTDLARTADIVSDNMTAMQVPVEKAQHFMDVYAYALTNSNVNLESLGETMKYAAPVAAAFGASLEDTAAMTMMMGNAGIKGSMAGTALRMGLLRLSGPPKKASKAMNELGISVSDATAMALESEAELARLGIQYDKNAPPMEKMGNIINQLSTKMQGLSREEKLASIGAIFGANAASGWVNIIEQGPEVFNKYLNALKNCDGYSEQFAHTMNDDTRGAMIALESAMDAVVNSVGTALLPAVRSAAEAFTPIATAAAQFIQAHPGIIQAAAAIAAALASIVVGAAAVKLAFAGWKFITSSILLVQEALGALAGGQMMTGLIANVTRLRTALFGLGGAATFGGWSAMFTSISTTAATAATSVRAFFASLTLGSAASGIAATLSSIGTAIAGAARAAMAFAFSPIGVALMALALAGMYCYQNWDRVGPVFSNIAGIITGELGPAITQIQAAFSALSSSGGFSALSAAASQLASVVGGTLVKAFAVLLTIAASAVAGIIQLLANLATVISDIGTGMMDAFAKVKEGDFSGAFDALTSAGSKALTDIKKLGSDVLDSVGQGAKNVQSVLDALNMPKMPTAEAVNRHRGVTFDESGVAHSAPEQPPIDTSATQAALDQVGSSASNAASQMQTMETATAGIDQMSAQFAAAGAGVDQMSAQFTAAGAGVQQMATSATQAGAGVQTFSTNAQQAGAAAQTFGTSAQNAASGTDALGTSAAGATSGIEALSSSAAGATGGVSALGSAASGAAGSVSGLGAAVQSACAALASAGASAAAAVSSAAPKANYKGGIYPKGQFLTTFAEKSPEAAIPIDNSKRARELWTQTGQLLGMLPGNGGSYDSAKKDALGNIVGIDIPEYNRIGEGDTEDVKISKRRVQREQYERERAKREIIQPPQVEQPKIQQLKAPKINQPEIQSQAIEITRAARENYLRQRLENPELQIPQPKVEQPQAPKINQPEIQRQAIEITRAARENYLRQRLENPELQIPQPKVEQPQAPQINQPEIQRQVIEITRTARENYLRQRLANPQIQPPQIQQPQVEQPQPQPDKVTQNLSRLREALNYLPDTKSNRETQRQFDRILASQRRRPTTASERVLQSRRAQRSATLTQRINDVRLPSGYTIGDALKILPQRQAGSSIPTTPPFMPTEEKTSGGFLDILKKIFGNVGVLDEIGGKIGEALKILPTLKPREVPKRDDAAVDLSKAPMITTPPFVPTDSPIASDKIPMITTPPFAPMDSPITGGRVPMTSPFYPTGENGSGFSLANLTQIIPGFKGNIGGFDILGGLSGGNIFGSFGALDGLGGGFSKQGKNPFPSTPISFGGILNKLGSIGNFGALGDLGGGLGKIGGLDDLPVLNSNSAGGSVPTEFHVTINVTVNGNADENAVRRGVEQAIPSLDDWARNFAAFKHDEARRSFV